MRQAIIGIVSVLVVASVAGVSTAFLMTPVRVTCRSPWVWVAEVGSIPEDGTPIRVTVVERQRDAWTWMPERKLGYVFLRRVPETDEVVALSQLTWYGAIVRYDAAIRMFDDPCRLDWHFDLDGKCLADPGWSDLLKLEVQIRDGSVYIAHKLPRWGD